MAPPPTHPPDEIEPLDPQLEAIAAAILDGGDVTPAALASAAGGAFADEFRIIAEVAQLHQSLQLDQPVTGNLPRQFPWAVENLVLNSPLGRGTSGEVFRAWDTQLH